jgi:Bacterial cellulose synthase subunit
MTVSAFLKRLLFYLVLSGAVVGLWGGPARPGYARGQVDDESIVSFARLGATEKSLRGPFDSGYIDFSLPANWKLNAGAQLQLRLNTFFAGDARAVANTAAPGSHGGRSFGGTLQVQLNNVTLSTVLLDRPGEHTITIPITTTALLPARSDGRHLLSMLLDTYEPCGAEQYTSVVIRSSSALLLPHQVVAAPTDLARLPLPIFQRSFLPDAATIVTPDAPTAAELQAALAIAAGFGRMTGGALALNLIPAARLTDELKRSTHLIFVGKPSAFPMLKEARLPAPPSAHGFAAPGVSADDGVVQMAVSPWNNAKVLLIAGGDDDSGVIKAAQAISSGAIRTGERPDLALIAATHPQVAAASASVDRTFADLGYDAQKMYGLGGQYVGYRFDIPAGQAITGDAYVDLVFVHTALLDYDQSDLIVSLNDEPIASVRLDDNSTRLGSARLTLPASALHPGSNQLTIRADLLPRVVCTDPRGSGLWMIIRPESLFHLPLGPSQDSKVPKRLDLSTYPSPFTARPNLSALAFVLGVDDPTGWNIATQIAADLGRQMHGTLVDLVVAYGDTVPEQIRKERDLLVIGRPGKLALIGELRSSFPAPFAPGSSLASEPDAPIAYRMPRDTSLGYLELLPAPWSAERTVLAVLGSNDQGLAWAGAALTTPYLRGALTGNLAVIQGERIESRDTRPKTTAAPGTQPAAATAQPEQVKRPNIFLLLAAGIVALIMLGGAILLVVWWRRRSTQRAGVMHDQAEAE